VKFRTFFLLVLSQSFLVLQFPLELFPFKPFGVLDESGLLIGAS